MRLFLSLVLGMMVSVAFAVGGSGIMPVQIRDYGTALTYNIVVISPNVVIALNGKDNAHEWIVQNVGTNNVNVWFDTSVTSNIGFSLLPNMVLGDSGGPRLYAYSTDYTRVAVYQRLSDFFAPISAQY